jgi:hypothetical protein
MSRRLTPAWRTRATLASTLFPPLVHFVSLERISRWIDRRPRPKTPDSTVDDASIAEWVDRVLTRLPPPWRRTCLKRALVLHYLLHRAGRPAELVIGVRRDERNELAAHAWLARGGTPYLEPGADHVDSYQVLTVFPTSLREPS